MKLVILGQAILHEPVEWEPGLREIVRGADAVICNFEGCLPPNPAWPMKRKTVHPSRPAALSDLSDLGVTHLGLANNHAWDFGHAGMLATRKSAESRGFAVAGVGVDAGEAWRPALRNGVALLSVDAGPTPDWAVAGPGPGIAALGVSRVLGLPRRDLDLLDDISRDSGEAERLARRIAVGFDTGPAMPLGLRTEEAPERRETYRVSEPDLDRLFRAVESTRSLADIVVVAVHYHQWAADWLSPPNWFLEVGDRLRDAGADAVTGTGPPWPFAADTAGPKVLAPSLGNLAFHTGRPERYDDLDLPVWRGLALVLERETWSTGEFDVARP